VERTELRFWTFPKQKWMIPTFGHDSDSSDQPRVGGGIGINEDVFKFQRTGLHSCQFFTKLPTSNTITAAQTNRMKPWP
jgi:hypothetical protein